MKNSLKSSAEVSSVQALTDGSGYPVVRKAAGYNHMTRRTQITLPWYALSVNSMYRVWRGRFLLSATGRAWRKKTYAMISRIDACYDEPVSLEIHAWYRDRRNWDCDNILKGILDTLEHAPTGEKPLLTDDKWVYRLSVIKHDYDENKPDGEVWIDISPL